MVRLAAACGESGESCGATLFIKVDTILHDKRRVMRSVGGRKALYATRQQQKGRRHRDSDFVVASAKAYNAFALAADLLVWYGQSSICALG